MILIKTKEKYNRIIRKCYKKCRDFDNVKYGVFVNINSIQE
jgi:hypothetical protein